MVLLAALCGIGAAFWYWRAGELLNYGDAAAQGFIHGFAGLAMFIIALTVLFTLDGVIRWIIVDRLQEPLR